MTRNQMHDDKPTDQRPSSHLCTADSAAPSPGGCRMVPSLLPFHQLHSSCILGVKHGLATGAGLQNYGSAHAWQAWVFMKGRLLGRRLGCHNRQHLHGREA